MKIPHKLGRLAGSLHEVPPPPPRLPPCVYFLLQGRHIQYVGRTIDLWGRIDVHRRSSRIKFNRVLYLPVPESELKWVEKGFIRELNTPHNGGSQSRAHQEKCVKELRRLVRAGLCTWCETKLPGPHKEGCPKGD